MRNFISSIFVAAAVGLVLDAVVLPAGFSFAVNVGPSVDRDLRGQVVDRTRKSDRLQAPLASRRKSPPRTPTMLIGCEPAFSSLSTGAHANFAGRCLS
jgi:hypothetical protein